uniref:PHD-type domain-containing protein n=2 Tax=Parascaris univalens TaxID=6257 RepID=A0A915AB79_PARUN
MIPTSKVSRQPVSATFLERRKRDREKERSRLASKRNIPPEAKNRFGRKFQTTFCELAMSDDPAALDQMQVMHTEELAYYEEHNLTELPLSDDENDARQVKAPISKKMHHDVKVDQQRPMGIMRLKSSSSTDEREKIRTKIVSPLAAATPLIMPSIDLSEDSEDDTSKKTGVAHVKTFKLCDVCSDASSTSVNALLECEDCGKAIHQKCNRPEVTPAQARDPRFLFVCCNCKDRDTKAERSISASMMTKPQSAICSKKDDKTITQKPPSDLSTAWATFAAKKKKPVNMQGSFGTVSRVGSIVGTAPRSFPSFGGKEKK